MSCLYVSARLRVCSSRALSRLCALFRVGAWCSDPGTLSWVSVSCRGSVRSVFCLVVWVGSLEFARLRILLSTCVLWCCTQFVFLSAKCIHVVMSCVNMWLMSILISCVFVSCFAHGWWFVLLAMCLCFWFVWVHGFVLIFCVPCALMSICLELTPPILLPEY